MPNSYLCTQKRFGKGQKWSFIGPGSEKKCTLSVKDSWNLQKAVCPIFRATSPFVQRVDSKGTRVWKIVDTSADLETIETIFRIIVSANQLSLYGAVAEMCEEYEYLHDRTGQPVAGGQSSSSLVLIVIKTEVPLDCDDPVNQDLLLQQYGERIEKLSQQDKLRKFCMDAGFLNVVEIAQYFMTKDTAEFSQFHAVACREYTLPREDEASQPKVEIATCCLHGQYGVEIRISSVNRENSHSWVRISHGSNKFVMNLTTMSGKFQKFSSNNMW